MAGDEAAAPAASPAAAEDDPAHDGAPSDSANAGASTHALRATAEPIFATLADAEDASYAFLRDLVDDMFAAMRVAEENERAVRVAVAYAWTQALGGARVAAALPTASADDRMAPCLRPRVHDDKDEDHTAAVVHHRPTRRLNRPHEPVAPFLAALWVLVDRHTAFVESQLARFKSARFQVSSVPSHGRAGEWQILVRDLGPFLRGVARAGRLSVLGSAVEFVVAANAPWLAKKAAARGHLQLSHIALCVQTALLQAEAQEERIEPTMPPTSNGVFQTEVVACHDDGGDDDNDALLVYYDEGADPEPLAIDRNATGTVAHKAELGAAIVKRQRLAKSIVSLIQRRESGNSKWGALRKRMIVREHHVGVAVEVDMMLDAGPPPSAALQKSGTMTSKQLTTGSSPTKKISVASTSASTPRASMATSPSKHFREPDAAALANIFSLGTPRQLSPEELARRNDILSILEREEASASRKMAVASITSVSLPPPCAGPDGKPIVSDRDKAFQAYVAANSSVTMSGGSCIVPTALTVNSASPEKMIVGGSSGKPPADPKRTRLMGDKTRFELALEPPRFEVADGNSHVRLAAAAAAAAEAANRKTRTRGGVRSPAQPNSSPAKSITPHPPLSPQQSSHSPTTHHPRPLDTASGHLPQLDTSRLAVGVKAVVRGVEKRGPRHDPSRNSRLRLHNYATSPTGEYEEPSVPTSPSRPSPEKREHLPPVSPIKASPHRKHVAFPDTMLDPKNLSPSSPTRQLQEPSPVPPAGSRRFPAKQPTFEKRASPPRVRNRILTESANNSTSKKHYARAKWAERDANDDLAAMHAPRRNLTHHETMADY